jgi:hypothetical protein
MFTSNLVINLIELLSKGIGLKSLTFDGLSIFVIRVIYEPFMLCKHRSRLKKELHRS